MGLYGDLLGYENIEIVSPYPIQQLTELKIVRRLNCHTTLYYTGIIPEEKQDQYIDQATAQDTLTVNRKEASGEVTPLFKGLVSKVGVKTARGIYYLEVEGISSSAKLDINLRSRSFQNKAMKFEDLLNQIAAAYPGSEIKDTVSNGATIDKFILQSNETDWQLTKRLASRFNSFLVPYDVTDQVKFWFGRPDADQEEKVLPEGLPYQIGKNLQSFAELSENYLQSVTDSDFSYFTITTGQYYPLGSKVRFKDIPLMVAGSTAELKEGSLIYEYRLSPEYGLKQKPLFNRQIIGAALKGKVIDISKDTVRVHLDIDAKQDKNTAWWFPYSSFYTAEGNSGFYCMPQVGDYLQVYFPTEREEAAIATNSVRKNNTGSQKTQDPGIKYWGTNYGKELKLAGDELTLTAKDDQSGKLLIKMNDDQGIEIQSDHELYLTSRKNLTFDLEKKATVKAKNEIEMVCGSSSIVMDGTTHLKSAVVEIKPG